MIKCQILTVVLGLIVIVLGGSLYIFYRSESLALFEWVRAVGMYDWVDSMRPEEDIDSWLVYSLPDGLWLLSYILFMAALRNFDIRESLLYSAPLIVGAFVSEFLQMSDKVKGTFDIVDLMCYATAVVLGVVYVRIINKCINKK